MAKAWSISLIMHRYGSLLSYIYYYLIYYYIIYCLYYIYIYVYIYIVEYLFDNVYSSVTRPSGDLPFYFLLHPLSLSLLLSLPSSPSLSLSLPLYIYPYLIDPSFIIRSLMYAIMHKPSPLLLLPPSLFQCLPCCLWRRSPSPPSFPLSLYPSSMWYGFLCLACLWQRHAAPVRIPRGDIYITFFCYDR